MRVRAEICKDMLWCEVPQWIQELIVQPCLSLRTAYICSISSFVMRFCRCTPPPLSRTSGTPRGSTSAPGSGRTGWWGAWLCCNHVRSTGSDSWCLWRTTGRPYLRSSGRACRSWGTLPGRPGQWCGGSGRVDGGPRAPSPRWPRWWRSALAPRYRIDTSAAARCRGKGTAASNKSARRKSRRRRDTCRLFSARSSLPEMGGGKKAGEGEKKRERCQFFQFDSWPGLLSGRSIWTEWDSFLQGG